MHGKPLLNCRAMGTSRKIEDILSRFSEYEEWIDAVEVAADKLDDVELLVREKFKELEFYRMEVYSAVSSLLEQINRLQEAYEREVEWEELSEMVSDAIEAVEDCQRDIEKAKQWVVDNKKGLMERLDAFRRGVENFEEDLLRFGYRLSDLAGDLRRFGETLNA